MLSRGSEQASTQGSFYARLRAFSALLEEEEERSLIKELKTHAQLAVAWSPAQVSSRDSVSRVGCVLRSDSSCWRLLSPLMCARVTLN